MAIRVRKGRKNPFLVYWRNPFTKKIESQSFATKEEAEKHNALTQYRLRYERDFFIPEVTPVEEAQAPDTLESVFYQYLRERNFSQNNLYITLKSSQAIIGKYGDMEVGDIDLKVLQDMQNLCLEAGNKGSTVRRKMAIFKAMLGWARRKGIINQLPVFPEIPKSEASRYVPPSPEEISRIYDAAPPHLQRIIILGFMLGIRVGPCELMRLKWTDVNFEGSYIRVKNANKGNQDPWREVPIKEALIPLFKQWHEQDKNLGLEYLVHFKGKPVHSIKRSWKATLEKAGISRHIRPYDLRHGFATEAIAAGGDYGTVAAIMGHKSPVMVLRHYQHVKDARKKSVIENLPQPKLKIPCMTKDV